MDGLQDYLPSNRKPSDSLPLLLHPLNTRFIDSLCLCYGTCTVILQLAPMLDMDLVAFTPVQCIQPGPQL